jgi:hypothetical protein
MGLVDQLVLFPLLFQGYQEYLFRRALLFVLEILLVLQVQVHLFVHQVRQHLAVPVVPGHHLVLAALVYLQFRAAPVVLDYL